MQEVREFGGEKCLDPLRVLLPELYDDERKLVIEWKVVLEGRI